MNQPMQDDSRLNVPFGARLQNPARDYARSATAFMWLGWLGLGALLMICIFGFVVINATRPLLAVEDGQVVGTVQYDDRQIRSLDQINRDLKQWLVHFVNVDANTLWEDRAIAGAHMCPRQRNIELGLLQEAKPLYDTIVSQRVRGSVNFDFEAQKIKSVQLESYVNDHFRAVLRGEVVSGISDHPKVRRVQYRVAGRFVQRTRQKPLALEICDIQLLKWTTS